MRGFRAAIGSVVVVGALIVTPFVAHAAPVAPPSSTETPTTSGEVVASLAKLAIANEKLTETFNQAQIDVKRAKRDAGRAVDDADAAADDFAAAKQALASSVASQYKSASFSRTAALLSSNSGQNYFETVQSMNILSMHQTEIAREAAAASSKAKAAREHAQRLVAATVAKQDEISKQRDELGTKIAKQKTLLATLTAAERARFIQQTAPVATAAQVSQVTTQAAAQAPTAQQIVPTGKGASTAVAAALSQLGKPYVWGAGGPDSYDCSGLTMWSWAHAGVNLPHQSAEQQGMGTPVDRSQLQPGDLVFFGSPAYHVGMYVGNGMMVHAPTTGDVVKVSPLSMMSDYSGATRVG
ncbi:MAG: Cell wall-associated hydrolase, invasion-associated protein [Frankiales bacterium]|nr:Cell wall-associated hydrolase, invasion-associated protein [Frankiales bacterium]